jgi:hypothetical protein
MGGMPRAENTRALPKEIGQKTHTRWLAKDIKDIVGLIDLLPGMCGQHQKTLLEIFGEGIENRIGAPINLAHGLHGGMNQ